MGDKTAIEWTDASWTPIRAWNLTTVKIGWHCEHATTGCEFCYAEGMNKRLGTGLPFKPGHRKDIEIFLDEEMLLAPFGWKKPRKIFVCSMTDAFAEFVKDEWLDRMFAVMALCPQHTFQVLTKRAERMMEYCGGLRIGAWRKAIRAGYPKREPSLITDPLPNLWLGVSCERQREWDERTEYLRNTPCAVRFVSAEPLLGSIVGSPDTMQSLDWLIVGGESGPNARPMHPDWARSLRDQCQAVGMAFFFKQWGEWQIDTRGGVMPDTGERETWIGKNGKTYNPSAPYGQECWSMMRVGKKAAGRLLDGRTWDEFPEVSGPR